MDDFSDDNPSFKARLQLAKGSKSFEMIARPIQGILTCEKFFPPGTKLSIEMTRSKPEFCLSGPAPATPIEYIVQVTLVLYMVRHTLLFSRSVH